MSSHDPLPHSLLRLRCRHHRHHHHCHNNDTTTFATTTTTTTNAAASTTTANPPRLDYAAHPPLNTLIASDTKTNLVSAEESKTTKTTTPSSTASTTACSPLSAPPFLQLKARSYNVCGCTKDVSSPSASCENFPDPRAVLPLPRQSRTSIVPFQLSVLHCAAAA